MRSFLDGRSIRVEIGSDMSAWVRVLCGVPQGSVLGSLFYILYTADLTQVITTLGALVHHYADDVQIYSTCSPYNALQCISKVMESINGIQNWMSSNRLRLNPAKTQFIWLGSRWRLSNIDKDAILRTFPNFVSLHVVRDLGVMLDEELTMADHVNALCRTCYYELRQIRFIRRNLSHEAAITLVHSFIMTRLDYCNSILAGLPNVRLRQLQSVLNCAARVVANLTKFSHISAYMHDILHWLPAEKRIRFKLLLMARSSIAGLAPDYLSELFDTVSSCPGRRRLRSAFQGQYKVPRSRTMARAERAFSTVGPTLWNNLPTEIKLLASSLVQATFSSCIKTYLFRL